MKGLMQDWPLLVGRIFDHAYTAHPEREVVTRTIEGPIHRYTYKDAYIRSKKVAQFLQSLGVREGDRVATLAWNTFRHLEAWYGIPGTGAIYHTLNPRLFAEQLVYIINHAEDRFIFTDLPFVALLESIADKIPCVEGYIIMTDDAHMPDTTLNNVYCYEDVIADKDGDFDWVQVEETSGCGLCYTSGTTGHPKGVLYSHRSNFLHTLAISTGEAFCFSASDCILPVVPMYHANAWGIAFAAPAAGAKLVLPGARLDGEAVYHLLDSERVTFTAAVPTVWLGLLNYLEEHDRKLPWLERVGIGGSACPRIMIEKFEQNYDVEVFHLWGMTELNPVGTVGQPKAGMEEWPFERRVKQKLKQGRYFFTVEMKIVDDDGNTLPHDRKNIGHQKVRGPGVVKAYFKGEGGNPLDEEGWFDTGDVATIDELGYMQITDRSKDVIKSGGEWISSIELENVAVGHPDVAEAAVIGVPHPKWDERPLLIIVPKPDAQLSKEDILSYMKDKIAKWWMPDDIEFVEEIPHTATGKIQKTALREQFKAFRFKGEEEQS